MDGLQDLDRLIGVKYKVAESLSRKHLLQSLNLRTLNPVSSVVVYFWHSKKKKKNPETSASSANLFIYILVRKYLY